MIQFLIAAADDRIQWNFISSTKRKITDILEIYVNINIIQESGENKDISRQTRIKMIFC